MILLVDNYDSFTYNLYQYLEELGGRVFVVRNDALSTNEVKKKKIEKIVISPGPSRPESVPQTVDLILAFYTRLPILGVCLGHQCIGYALGAKIVQSKRIMHGKTSRIRHDGSLLFRGVENPFEGGRYHSLVIDRKTLPEELLITATSEDEEIMAIAHQAYPLFGIQFHPESVLTPCGKKILKNFLVMRT